MGKFPLLCCSTVIKEWNFLSHARLTLSDMLSKYGNVPRPISRLPSENLIIVVGLWLVYSLICHFRIVVVTKPSTGKLVLNVLWL